MIATNLAKRGANVAIHYNSPSSKEETGKTLLTLKDQGVKAVALQADLSAKAAVDKYVGCQALHALPLNHGADTRLFADALSGLGATKFDVAVNTVGKVLKKPLIDISEEEYDQMFDTNSKVEPTRCLC